MEPKPDLTLNHQTCEPSKQPVVEVLVVVILHHQLEQRLGHLLAEDHRLLEVILQLVDDGGGLLRPPVIVECLQEQEPRGVAVVDILYELGEVIPEHLQSLRRNFLT